MSGSKDIDLYRRGVDTAIAAWAVIARGSRDNAVVRAPGVAAGVFPYEPERSVYNNAVLEHGLVRAGWRTTRSRAGARPRRSSRPRWPSASTPPSAFATSAGSSSWCRPVRAVSATRNPVTRTHGTVALLLSQRDRLSRRERYDRLDSRR